MDFQLNIPDLENALTKLDEALLEIEDTSEGLIKANRELLDTSWKGKAANQFSRNTDNWDTGFKTFKQNLTVARELLYAVYQRASVLDQEASGFGVIFGGGWEGSAELLSLSLREKEEVCISSQRIIDEYENYKQGLAALKNDNSRLGHSSLSLFSSIDSIISEAESNQSKLRGLSGAAESYAQGIAELESMVLQGSLGIVEPEDWAGFSGIYLELFKRLGVGAFEALAKSMSLAELLAKLLGLNFNSCAYGGDPVNMATGNFVYEKEFLKTKGLMPLSFKMFYNAGDEAEHGLGSGWMHNLAVSVQLEENKAALIFEDGRREFFIKDGSGSYHQGQGLDNHLFTRDDTLVYASREGLRYSFSAKGAMLRKEDRNSNYLKLSYTEDGRIEKAESNSGTAFFFTYEEDKLIQVRDLSGRAISLNYTEGNLTCVTDESGACHRFSYDEHNKLAKITNPLGIDTLSNTYDEYNRMKEQVLADGGTISYFYDDEENKLTLTEQNGNEVIYIHDDEFRSIETIYTDGSDKYEYNDKNLRTKHTDKRGNATKFAYDRRGNLIRSVNPLGEILRIEYNHLNKPTKVRLDETVTLTTTYDNKGNATKIADALDRAIKLEYNDRGQASTIMHPDSSEVHITYDERGNILSVAEPATITSYSYDELNRPTKTIDAKGNKTEFAYNTRGDITKVTNAKGRERSYEYNASGKVTKIVDFDGSVISWEYNKAGKPSKLINQEGAETTLEYDSMQNISKLTDALGNTSLFEYNKLNRLECATNAKSATVRYAYDPCGNKTELLGPEGQKTSLSYDALNRVNEIVEPTGAKTTLKYNKFGQVIKVTNALGHDSLFDYDLTGQMTLKTDPSGQKTSYTYTPLGQIHEITDTKGRTLTHEYFPGGLLKAQFFPDGRSVKYTYDENKNLLTRSTQDGYTLFYEYDCLNQIVGITSNCGHANSYSYDAMGNVISVTDGCGNTTKYTYSPTGNLTSVTDALGYLSRYSYDKLGNLTVVEQLGELPQASLSEAELYEAQEINRQNAQIHTTRYDRDALGQVEKTTDSLGNSELFTYNDSGHLSSKTDKEGLLTKYAYDKTGQLAEVAYADGKSVLFSYNSLRQLTEIKDWLGTTSIDLDEAGRAREVLDHAGNKVEYAYGPSGERASITYPDGKTVDYHYDDALRLKTLTDGNQQVSYAYDENSRLAEKAFSNGTSSKYSYNDTGLLSELSHSDSQGILDRYVYFYDKSLNKTRVEKYRRGLEEESGIYQYTYDALSRLQGVAKDGEQTREYGYDAFGNRDFMVSSGVRTDYSYNSLNQLLRSESRGLVQDFAYDARGNLTQILENSKVTNTYEFSALNRLTRATSAKGQSATYDYNGLGFRTTKQTEGECDPTRQISYVLDLTKQYHNLLQSNDDTEVQSFTWDFNVVFADDRAFLQDELGSPVRFLDSDGTLLESYGYDEFGVDLYGNQGEAQPFGYTGYTADSIAKTYFAQAREYVPGAGRFVSEDIAKSGSNWFNYCNNNPTNLIDPLGLEFVVISGSEYDADGRYKYNFIEPAIKQLKELVDLADGETVTWVISTTGYSPADIKRFETIAADIGADVVKINSNLELQNYINSKSIEVQGLSAGRIDDPITRFVVFSHGVTGSVELGYGQSSERRAALMMDDRWIQGLSPRAFDNTYSSFYSCNTGTGHNSFAQQWVNLTGGKTRAVVGGKTDYEPMNVGQNIIKKILRVLRGFHWGGSMHYPVPVGSAYYEDFYTMCED
ncbi:MAG: DUF6531 domain-containing protein [Coriobacteriia bacterium]|nr:DUF6531 domain-containing protein [Coriobacteriia bacterium]MCL2749805.1 DUF6531 domain-containing protein [Coriobacteriia bacterium]